MNGHRLLMINPTLLSWSEEKRDELARMAPGWDLLLYPEPTELENLISGVEAAFGKPPIELLPKALSLRWLQLQGAGADRWVRALKDSDVLITNASGVHSIPISEHILALMFALARNLPFALRGQIERRWLSHSEHKVFELAGKSVILVGTGAIGGHFAKAASSLGMEVLGVRKHPDRGGEGMVRVVSPDRLPDVLPEGDFVVLTTPLTTETEGMIGRQELALMKPGSYLVNIGRGKLVDQAALIESLRKGGIAGAGLDVFEEEPLPPDSPLWGMENVVITSHYAGLSPRYSERLWTLFRVNFARYLAGEPLANTVDMKLGY